MNMKDTLSKLQKINESSMQECGDDYATPQATVMPPQETPPSMNVSVSMNANAMGKQHVNDLIDIMKNAGLSSADAVSQPAQTMRQDMDTFRSAVDGAHKMGRDQDYDVSLPMVIDDEDELTDAEEYMDTNYMTQDLSGGINKKKKAYAAAQRGDNAMAVEAMKQKLYAALSEKKSKSKPDYMDIDGDGDTSEPMKKAAIDKKKRK